MWLNQGAGLLLFTTFLSICRLALTWHSWSGLGARLPRSGATLLQAGTDMERYEGTKAILVSVIDHAWKRARSTLSSETLELCEVDLKGATSLLILATIRKSADEFASSKAMLEWMLATADVNQDGQLTFAEWYDWLLSTTDLTSSGQIANKEESLCKQSSTMGTDTRSMAENLLAQLRIEHTQSAFDPMVTKLGLVLGHAISALRITSRMSTDPNVLTAAYVAGGMIAGEVDEGVSVSMLSRLTSHTRNLVLQSIAMEATPTTMQQQLSSVLSSASRNVPMRTTIATVPISKAMPSLPTQSPNRPRLVASSFLPRSSQSFSHSSSSETSKPPQGAYIPQPQVIEASAFIESSTSLQQFEPVVSDSPFSGVIINETESNSSVQQQIASFEVQLLQVLDEAIMGPIAAEDVPHDASVTTMGTIARVESDLDLSQLAEEEASLSTGLATSQIQSPTTSSKPTAIALAVPSAFDQERNEVIVRRQQSEDDKEMDEEALTRELLDFSRLIEESVQVQNALGDLEDDQAVKMRETMLALSYQFSGPTQHKSVLAIALSLRAARLQNLFVHQQAKTTDLRTESLSLPYHSRAWRQQLALETLQLFAPLSYQLQLASYTPELEIHSYVHLFPQSFSSFVDWYTVFRPIARRVIDHFRRDFERAILLSESTADDDLERHPGKRPSENRMSVDWYDVGEETAHNDGSNDFDYEIHELEHETPSDTPSLTVAGRFTRKHPHREPSNGSKSLRLSHHCRRLTVQSRLKTPPSAFKKMIRGAKVRDQLFDILGIRIIAVMHDDAATEEMVVDADYESASKLSMQHSDAVSMLIDHNHKQHAAPSSVSPNAAAGMHHGPFEHEDRVLQHLHRLVTTELPGWREDSTRFKDYVSAPKPSGYQSLHTCLEHEVTGLRMELQLRSARMHWVAEHGSAAHSNYKALVLPTSPTLPG